MFLKHLILLASTPVIVSAQCGGYSYAPNVPQCGVNNGDGTYLESNLLGADSGCPNIFGHNYVASATYTDLSGAAQTIGLATPVTSPADPAATVTFLYNVAYSNIKDGTPVTVNYDFVDTNYYVTLPPFTIYNTIAYTDFTSTIISTIDAETITITLQSASTSTIPTTDATVQTDEVTTTVTSDTLITGAPRTVTSTSTYKPHPKTKKVYTVVHVTKTLSCIPNKRYGKREEGHGLVQRDNAVFDGKTYAQLSCGYEVPATMTLTTSTSFTTDYVTTTDTEVSFTTSAVSTSTSTVEQTDVVSATDTVTVNPPPVTTTVCTVARRKTVYTTSTLTNTVYKYTGHKLCYPPPPYHPKPNPTCRFSPPKPKHYAQKHH